jgi:hypothetical protein
MTKESALAVGPSSVNAVIAVNTIVNTKLEVRIRKPLLWPVRPVGGWYLGGMTKSNTIVANIATEKTLQNKTPTAIEAANQGSNPEKEDSEQGTELYQFILAPAVVDDRK